MAVIELIEKATQDWRFTRGDTFKVTWVINWAGTNFAGATVQTEWKESYSGTAVVSYSKVEGGVGDAELTLVKSTTTTTDDTLSITLEIPAATTEALSPSAVETVVYIYDVEIELASGEVYTPFAGNVLMSPDVTNP